MPNYLLLSTYGQGHVPPYATHLHGHVPLMPHTCSSLEVLASAALAQLPSAQGEDGVPPISSTEPANPGLLNIPGFASVPTKLIRWILGLEHVDMWELLP